MKERKQPQRQGTGLAALAAPRVCEIALAKKLRVDIGAPETSVKCMPELSSSRNLSAEQGRIRGFIFVYWFRVYVVCVLLFFFQHLIFFSSAARDSPPPRAQGAGRYSPGHPRGTWGTGAAAAASGARLQLPAAHPFSSPSAARAAEQSWADRVGVVPGVAESPAEPPAQTGALGSSSAVLCAWPPTCPEAPGCLRACVPCPGRWPLPASATHCPSLPEFTGLSPACWQICPTRDSEGERSRDHFPRQHSGAVSLTRRGSSHNVFIMTFCK